jgi:hypothetical protein
MRRYLLGGSTLLLALALCGCGSKAVVEEGSDETRLATHIDVSVADWLKLERRELAALMKEKMDTVRQEEDYARSNPDSVDLLPKLKPSISLPIFQDAEWSDKAGVTLPPYLSPGAKDREVALHLARFGDADAATLFADPGDADLKKQLDGLRGSRNYAVEWVRLVSLHQISAEFKLASGHVEAASTLVHLHRQLQKALDKRAASGPVGAALLPAGRHALAEAVPALRDPKVNKKRLADDIEAALKDWGEVPAPAMAVDLGTPRAEVARVFRSQEKGRVLTAVARPNSQRAVDLLRLPLTLENIDGVVAFLDKDDRLSELLVYYFNQVNQHRPDPANLAQPLVEAGVGGQEVERQKGIVRQAFAGGKFKCQVSVIQGATAGGTAAGAVARIGAAEATFGAGALPAGAREIGVLHLDKSFDQNRVALDPTARPERVVEVKRADAVARVRQPVVNPRPSSVVLTKEADFNLLASITVRWPNEENKNAFSRLMAPLWSTYGAARMEGVEDDNGGYMAFVWEDEHTRYEMRLPYVDVRPPELLIKDRAGPEARTARADVTATFDLEQRKARLLAGKPQERLPRWIFLNQVRLGMTRAEALAALPKRDTLHTLEIADGLNVLVLADAPKDVTHWAKQMFVRFTPGPQGHVAEIRVRYQEGPAAPGPHAPSLFDLLRKAPSGEPESVPSTWADIWTDLPKKYKPVHYRWLDDRTVMTYQRDAGGSELILRDCPLEYPLGQPLPPLQFCSRGLPELLLGQDRDAVLKRWKVQKPQVNEDGSVDLGEGPKESPYDAVAVWFDGGKVSRIMVRHRAKAGLQKEEVAAALQQFWSEHVDQLGIIRRTDTLGTESAVSQRLPSWGWHDDRTRVRCFGMDTEGGARLFTEWREWPLVAKPS